MKSPPSNRGFTAKASPTSPNRASRSRRPDQPAWCLRRSALRSSDTGPATGTRGTWPSEPLLSRRSLASGHIAGIIGLNSLVMPQPESAPATPSNPASTSARSAGTPTSHADGLTPCAAATSLASGQGWYTFDAEGSDYGMNSLLANGQNGTGETVGVYELAAHTPSDTSAYLSCFGLSNPVSTVNVDGGGVTGTGGTFEANIDIEQVATQAPHASIISYEGAPTSGTSVYDLWNTIVSDDAAQVVSTSWGDCEAAQLERRRVRGFLRPVPDRGHAGTDGRGCFR